MDTTKHLEVALAAHDKWLHDESDSRYWPEIAVAALDSNDLLCTEVEREFIEAWAAHAAPSVPYSGPERRRFDDARDALEEERAGKPVEPAPDPEHDVIEAVAGLSKGDVAELRKKLLERAEATIAEQAAEIAALKERLAAATRPRRVWHEAEQSRINPRGWRVFRHTDERRREGEALKDEVLHVIGDGAESIARAHAAKLDAEQAAQP